MQLKMDIFSSHLKIGTFFSNQKEEFINYPKNLIEDSKFDCIIIDGNPNEWRDLCTEPALKANLRAMIGKFLSFTNHAFLS